MTDTATTTSSTSDTLTLRDQFVLAVITGAAALSGAGAAQVRHNPRDAARAAYAYADAMLEAREAEA